MPSAYKESETLPFLFLGMFFIIYLPLSQCFPDLPTYQDSQLYVLFSLTTEKQKWKLRVENTRCPIDTDQIPWGINTVLGLDDLSSVSPLLKTNVPSPDSYQLQNSWLTEIRNLCALPLCAIFLSDELVQAWACIHSLSVHVCISPLGPVECCFLRGIHYSDS